VKIRESEHHAQRFPPEVLESVQRMEVKMPVSVKTLGIDRLNVDERLALVDEIWASICADMAKFPLTEAQRAELDRRVADDDAFPDDVLPWAEVKTAVRARLAK
jgi:putative addiction module component (TIGR02574 family)